MNTQEMLLAKLAEIDEGNFAYRVHLNCIMNQALDCPEQVRLQFPEQVTFTLCNNLNHNLKFDWDSGVLSFYANFGGTNYNVKIPCVNIKAIISDDQSIVQFGVLKEQSPAQPAKQTQPENTQHKIVPLLTKKHLSLVSDNTKN